MQNVSRPHTIVVGNEKGGSGKTTTAVHVIMGLLRAGWRVGSLDLDGRQQSLTRYLENRRQYNTRIAANLPMPRHISAGDPRADGVKLDDAWLDHALDDLAGDCTVLVVDCPGSDSALARRAHAWADILITPLNDSFVDLDLLARVDPETFKALGPSFYSEMVWASRKQHAQLTGRSIDWIVLRNRESALDAINKRRVGAVLEDMSSRIGFRYVQGLRERVIYREMFLQGVTLLDLTDASLGRRLTMSHIAARQELRGLIAELRLPPQTVPDHPY